MPSHGFYPSRVRLPAWGPGVALAAEKAGIEVFREPSPSPDGPFDVTFELPAESERHARVRINQALDDLFQLDPQDHICTAWFS
jgi:hypothetical protein